MTTITYTIEIKWHVRDYPVYGFGDDKNLYNLKTGRKLKQCYNSGSIGYWFSKKFVTLKSLKSKIYKPKKEYCPF